jgi:hypothetical protein
MQVRSLAHRCISVGMQVGKAAVGPTNVWANLAHFSLRPVTTHEPMRARVAAPRLVAHLFERRAVLAKGRRRRSRVAAVDAHREQHARPRGRHQADGELGRSPRPASLSLRAHLLISTERAHLLISTERAQR